MSILPLPSLLEQSGSTFSSGSTADPLPRSFPSHASRNIAFVDAGLDDVESLIQGLENTQIVLIDSAQDGIGQITAALSGQANLDAVHIFSHASQGALQLGDSLLGGGTIAGYEDQLQTWRSALSAQADLMLYGCNLVSGADGLSLIRRLSQITGADVAASDDMTGAGGDWHLEVSTGDIESEIALNAADQAGYVGQLSLLNNGDFEAGLTSWQSFRADAPLTTDAVSGSTALEISGSSRGVKQTVSAIAGETYTLTGSSKSTSTGKATLGLTFYDQNSNRVGGIARKITSDSWNTFTLEKTAPTGTESVRVWAYKNSDEGSFFVDNLSLDSDTVIPEPPTGEGELLSNPGFENGLSSWRRYTGTEQISATEAFEGSSALFLSAAGSGTGQTVNATPGETYQISGYGKSSSDGYVGFGFNFFDADNNKLGGTGSRVRSSDWQQYQKQAIAPEGTSTIRLWTTKAQASGEAFFDQLSLSPVSTTPEPMSGVLELEASALSVNEADGSLTVAIQRSQGSDGAVTVDYTTTAATATAGSDYTARSGTLSFAAGQTQQTVTIPILNDSAAEAEETFAFELSNATGGATLGATRTAQVTIEDDDEAEFTYNGSRYVLTEGVKNWQQAQAEAQSLGGNLVTINTAAEEAWLKQTFSDTEGFWIGLSDQQSEGRFEWASGEALTYTNWAPGEPNNGGGIQDFGWMNYGATRQWDDDSPSVQRRGIIEIGSNDPDPTPTAGLVGRWQFNELTPAAQVVDASGNGNDGTNINITPGNTSYSGPINSAPIFNTFNPRSGNFDGVNDYVSIGSSPELNFSNGQFTQSVWIRPTADDNAYHGILGYENGAGSNNRAPGIWTVGQTKIHAGFGDGTNWNNFITGDVLSLNEWNHVVSSFDGTAYKIHVDGQEVYTTDAFAGRTPTAVQQLDIGRVDTYFEGQIDEVRLYNRSLSLGEIQQLYVEQPTQAQAGDWSTPIEFPNIPVAAAVLPNGKVVTWSSWDRFTFGGSNSPRQSYTSIWDPATGEVSEVLVTNTAHDMFCPGIAMLSDGRLLVNGGGEFVTSTSIFDFETGEWSDGPDMEYRRWYNSSLTLADGDVFTIGGERSNGSGARITTGVGEVFDLTDGWRTLSNAPIAPIANTGDRGTEHPQVFLAPNGKVFAAGPSPTMYWYDTNGEGSITAAGERGDSPYSQVGMSVMYDTGKILFAGGSLVYDRSGAAGYNTAYSIDINNENAVAVDKQDPMSYRRVYATGVVLPNGQVLAMGGQQDTKAFTDNQAVYRPELWDPNTGEWTLMDNHEIPRTYHSVSLLLPDGRVMAGGGGLAGAGNPVNHPDVEIFTPPYLYNADGTLADRPVIGSGPDSVGYNQDFSITMNTGEPITEFNLVRMSAVTHGVNTDQRFLSVDVTAQSGNTYTLNAPDNGNIAPPGYYMLFALNSDGVPSEAKMIQIT